MLLFRTIDELVEGMGALLADPAGLEALGRRQQARAAAVHGYRPRMRRLLELCGVAIG